MKRIAICIIIVLTFLSLSAVSSADNMTCFDDLQADETCDVLSVNETQSPEPARQNTTLTPLKTVGYDNFETDFAFSLTTNSTPLPMKDLNITINGVSYNRTTDINGQASVKVKLATGKYDLSYSYAGDENTTPASGTGKITIKDAVKTKIKCADKNINYRQGLKNTFMVRLTDANGNGVKNQNVTIEVKGKKYTVKTDKKGYAEVCLNLKKGKYNVKFSFNKNAPYLSSKGSYTINVKKPMVKGNGYWVWAAQMNSLDLKKLSKKGTKNIFLHSYAISSHGKGAVVKFIKRAHKYGIKVHIWMQVCYNGKWVRPCNPDNTIKYGFLNSKIKEAKSYAKISGVDGVHFDYVRFGGTAHLYKKSTEAINYFVKKASIGIHKIKPNCIVSAAVMPEPKMMIYWYGQDIPTMGRYLDAIVPMVYKGNFKKDSTWITEIVKLYKGQSKSAVIWAGLQAYKSDSNTKLRTHSELLKDAKAAKAGGATGSILFRIGFTHYLNFKAV